MYGEFLIQPEKDLLLHFKLLKINEMKFFQSNLQYNIQTLIINITFNLYHIL